VNLDVLVVCTIFKKTKTHRKNAKKQQPTANQKNTKYKSSN